MKRSLPLVLSAVLIVNLAFNILDNDNGITIDFLDVGQGDASLIHLEGGQHILIDGGPEKSNLPNILLKQGVTRLDAVFLSHLHSDHYMGLMNCSESIEVESIFHGDVGFDQDIISELMSLYPNTKFTELKRGDSVEYGSVRFDVLHPSKLSDASEYIDDMNPNNLSLTLLMHCSDNTILFSGDIESEVESTLAKTNVGKASPLDVDILKVAHHGSKTSTHNEFISAFQPEIAVIQVGDNYFGHPASETLKRLQESGVMVYRNDTQGCIRIKLSEKGTEIEPWLVLEH